MKNFILFFFHFCLSAEGVLTKRACEVSRTRLRNLLLFAFQSLGFIMTSDIDK